jgi:hypothetical protein
MISLDHLERAAFEACVRCSLRHIHPRPPLARGQCPGPSRQGINSQIGPHSQLLREGGWFKSL